jgi:hypothetical protein
MRGSGARFKGEAVPAALLGRVKPLVGAAQQCFEVDIFQVNDVNRLSHFTAST